MKKFYVLYFAAFSAVMMLHSCSKNHETEDFNIIVSGEVKGNTADIATVAAIIPYHTNSKISTAPFVDGGFTMNLPDQGSSAHLAESYFQSYGITKRPFDTRCTAIHFIAYDAGGNLLGYFELRNSTNDIGAETAQYIYSNSDMIVYDGIDPDMEEPEPQQPVITDPSIPVITATTYATYSLSLRKGWNIYSRTLIDYVPRPGGFSGLYEYSAASNDLTWHYEYAPSYLDLDNWPDYD